VNHANQEVDPLLFVAGIGHELRNPLAVMDSSFFLLRQRVVQLGISDPVVLDQLAGMEEAIAGVKRAIEGLLAMTTRAERPPPS